MNLYHRKHYVEYLAEQIREKELDPIDIMDITEITVLIERHNQSVPVKEKKEKDKDFINRLRQVRFFCV